MQSANSYDLYRLARSLQFQEHNYDAAVEKYNELLNEFPSSEEAPWAQTQIDNIGNMTHAEKTKGQGARPSLTEDEAGPRLAKPRFQTMSSIGELVSALGWIVLFVSIIAGIMIIAVLGKAVLGLVAAVSLGGLSLGLIIIVNGQTLQAVVAIENNTARTVQLLETHRRNNEEGTPT